MRRSVLVLALAPMLATASSPACYNTHACTGDTGALCDDTAAISRLAQRQQTLASLRRACAGRAGCDAASKTRLTSLLVQMAAHNSTRDVKQCFVVPTGPDICYEPDERTCKYPLLHGCPASLPPHATTTTTTTTTAAAADAAAAAEYTCIPFAPAGLPHLGRAKVAPQPARAEPRVLVRHESEAHSTVIWPHAISPTCIPTRP